MTLAPRLLLTAPYRGNLMDVLVFLGNLGPTQWFSHYVIGLARTADTQKSSSVILGLLFLAALLLPATGAMLKRWHTHQRLGSAAGRLLRNSGCLFSPLFYLPLTLVVISGVIAGIAPSIFPGYEDNGGLFVGLLLLGLCVGVVQTVLVYRYFEPPRQAPRMAFLRSPTSEFVADICLNLNMMLYQVVWGILSSVPFSRVQDLEDFAGRLFFLAFTALLFYFPPRMLYLAEDLQQPRSWVTLLLANASTIARVLIGTR